jgi:hypothetical protein
MKPFQLMKKSRIALVLQETGFKMCAFRCDFFTMYISAVFPFLLETFALSLCRKESGWVCGLLASESSNKIAYWLRHICPHVTK